MITSRTRLALIFIAALIILIFLLATLMVRSPAMRYYLTVKTDPADIVKISGEGWYDKGTIVNLTAPQFVPNATGVSGQRYRFANWTVDGQVSMTLQITVHMDANHTAIAHYVLQYYLSMSKNFGSVAPGSGWYDAGTVLTIQATAPSASSGEQYVWNGWTGTGSGSYTNGNNPASVTMNGPITEVASWTHQYYLTVNSAYDTPGGSGWYNSSLTAYATLSSGTVSGGSGVQYVFTGWSGDASGSGLTSNAITMNAPKTATANWKTQYYLNVTSPYDTPSPSSGWFNASSSITESVTSPVSGGTGTQYVCTGWTGTGSVPSSGSTTSTTFTIAAPSNITWNWKTQYYLTVRTDPLGIVTIPGEGWYDASTNVTLTAPSVAGYNFLNWDVDGVSQGAGVASITLSMNMPHNATAHYTKIITYTLTITTTTGGTTNPSPGTYTYVAGSTVSVTAKPNMTSKFDHWELDGVNVGSVNTFTVLMNQDHTLKAVFVYSPPVGGYAAPIDMASGKEAFPLLASQIGLAFALLAAMAATILLTKRRSKTLK